ncbi:hypothetical protein DICPUDRAFT_80941 [Dictyostelium purpureum]|uniref:Cytochrome P450 family protein n=1 Tax=Dictyostelium purpureum TaxID=5786 RepID=F0ZS04_DICPU|nr:uncharacterized protein DICPUDRAFT_80941 [Dictyostelium purpureum]EGC33287.1 hypothetical protein DICPUDRAFT_80941 [Dictyostelium purpureum]|eukprot:XP_003290188.1 hypothetical protein DICPUDRAFT_80941 [Dictyostelium purpureum]
MVILNTIVLSIIIILTLLILKDFLCEERIKKINKNIPGPKEIPIFGNLFDINFKNVPSSIDRLYRKYGPIYRIRCGNVETVVITGNQYLEECFIKNKFIFQERFVKFSRKMTKGLNIIYSNGEYWHRMKNVVLKELTFRKIKSFQPDIQKQVELLSNKLNKNEEIIENNFVFLINEMFLNIMLNFVYGNYEDLETKKNLINIITRFVIQTGQFVYSDYVPLLLPIDIINITKSNLISDYLLLTNYAKKIIDNYDKNYVEINNKEIDPLNEKRKSMMECYYEVYKSGGIKYESIIGATIDLVLAGTDSSANILSFIIVALINNPEIQEKVHSEIKSNLINSDITNTDHLKCPYTIAVIKEAHRYFSIGPLSESHRTTDDVEIYGYRISKGTQIIQNIASTHKSPEFWEEPYKFYPERFLRPHKPLYHYGIGLRSCIGKSFADYILFVSLVSLIKKFKFINPNPNIPINEEGDVGAFIHCKNFKVLIKRRK